MLPPDNTFESFQHYLTPPNGTATPIEASVSNPFGLSYAYTYEAPCLACHATHCPVRED
jgi:hypothetical protein